MGGLRTIGWLGAFCNSPAQNPPQKMNNENKSPLETKTKKINWNLTLSWIFGVMFALAGAGQIITEPIMGILLIALSIIIIPFTREKINEKLDNRLSKKLIIIISVIVLIVVGVFASSDLETDNSKVKNNNNKQVVETKPKDDFVSIGETAYLRLPNTKDPEQMICLGPTKESYGQIMKSISVKDFLGVFEAGGFCVGNGTKVQVIDVSFSMKKVRIMEGVREIDQNVLLRTGWVATEWVVKD